LQITIVDGQCNLFGLPQPSEETKLFVVAMSQTELRMRASDDQLRPLESKMDPQAVDPSSEFSAS
jgi:hypothetical protein